MTQPTRAEQLDSEFIQFLRDNPTVYPKFRLLAVKLKAKGIDRWGQSHLGSAPLRDGSEVSHLRREVRPK